MKQRTAINQGSSPKRVDCFEAAVKAIAALTLMRADNLELVTIVVTIQEGAQSAEADAMHGALMRRADALARDPEVPGGKG
jgi:hypothetical protein